MLRATDLIGQQRNKKMSELIIPTMAELLAKGEEPEILFWVGCAGSFDERAQ